MIVFLLNQNIFKSFNILWQFEKKISEIKPTKLNDKKEKEKVHDTVTELCNKRFEGYYNEY